MYNWGEAFKISKIILITAFSIFIVTVLSNSDVGKHYFEWIIDKPGYETLDNFLMAYMRVDGYISLVSLVVAILSSISYMIARIKKT